jgi:hypothetical protein
VTVIEHARLDAATIGAKRTDSDRPVRRSTNRYSEVLPE